MSHRRTTQHFNACSDLPRRAISMAHIAMRMGCTRLGADGLNRMRNGSGSTSRVRMRSPTSLAPQLRRCAATRDSWRSPSASDCSSTGAVAVLPISAAGSRNQSVRNCSKQANHYFSRLDRASRTALADVFRTGAFLVFRFLGCSAALGSEVASLSSFGRRRLALDQLIRAPALRANEAFAG